MAPCFCFRVSLFRIVSSIASVFIVAVYHRLFLNLTPVHRHHCKSNCQHSLRALFQGRAAFNRRPDAAIFPRNATDGHKTNVPRVLFLSLFFSEIRETHKMLIPKYDAIHEVSARYDIR